MPERKGSSWVRGGIILGGGFVVVGIIYVIVSALFTSGRLVAKYQIASELDDTMCLGLPTSGYGDGTPVVQLNCVPSHPDIEIQAHWLLNPNGNILSNYTIISSFSGKCMEADLASGVIQQAKCSENNNQIWVIQRSMTGSGHTIMSLSSNKCLTSGFGSKLSQENCANIFSQIWSLKVSQAPNPPKDSGKGELCDACAPPTLPCQLPGQCIITPTKPFEQTICGKECSKLSPCPTGYMCSLVPTKNNEYVPQCIPGPPNYECPFP